MEEAELQSLEQLPYSSLRPEFRAGVEALRTQLTATCHSSPKMVGGQPLILLLLLLLLPMIMIMIIIIIAIIVIIVIMV